MKPKNNLKNTYDMYHIVNSEGKVVEKFRLKTSADNYVAQNKYKMYGETLKIVTFLKG